jgi:hypothetical protein
MFINFFFTLREAGVPLSLNSFLTLQKALNCGIVENMSDFYITARSILIKNIEIERPVSRPPSHRSLRAVFPHRAPQYCSPRTSAKFIPNILLSGGMAP